MPVISPHEACSGGSTDIPNSHARIRQLIDRCHRDGLETLGRTHALKAGRRPAEGVEPPSLLDDDLDTPVALAALRVV